LTAFALPSDGFIVPGRKGGGKAQQPETFEEAVQGVLLAGIGSLARIPALRPT